MVVVCADGRQGLARLVQEVCEKAGEPLCLQLLRAWEREPLTGAQGRVHASHHTPHWHPASLVSRPEP